MTFDDILAQVTALLSGRGAFPIAPSNDGSRLMTSIWKT